MLEEKDLIFDWNTLNSLVEEPKRKITIYDETLRDGIQSPSVKDPEISEKKQLVHLMEKLGIYMADLGLPGAGPRAVEDVTALVREIVDNRLKLKPACAGRTIKVDIDPMIQISQKTGIPITACLFLGSSPIRQYAEGWTLGKLLQLTEEAVSYAANNGLPVMYVTEDTTRSKPEELAKLYKAAIDAGATRICIADTVGHATPSGTSFLVRFIKRLVFETGKDVKIDWHGHADRGFSVINAIHAIHAGADQVHVCALGVGERVGNVPTSSLLVNLKLMGLYDHDLSALAEYSNLVSKACRVPIPSFYPVIGKDAFRTGTGVHAAAIIKAEKKGHEWLADRIYSGVPAGMFGFHQKIEVGHMSGESNVIYWLTKRGIDPENELVKAIFSKAKQTDRLLEEAEVWEIVDSFQKSKAAAS